MSKNGAITLGIFVTSDVPDLYINILGYCMDHYEIGRVVLLGVLEDRGQRAAVEVKLSRLRERIQEQLSALQHGEYLYTEQGSQEWNRKPVDIEDVHRSRYSRIARQPLEARVLLYDELGKEIGAMASGPSVFDVTGVLKALLIDIYTILVMRGVNEVRAFELRLPSRTHDERELIHNLSLDRRDYEYVNLATSKYTAGVEIAVRAEGSVPPKQVANVVEAAASALARRSMMIYSIVVIGVLSVITTLILKKRWDDVEPLTYLLFAAIPYAFACVLVSFGTKSISFSPQALHAALKAWEQHRLLRFHRLEPRSTETDVVTAPGRPPAKRP
jgi:hypothetical protein